MNVAGLDSAGNIVSLEMSDGGSGRGAAYVSDAVLDYIPYSDATYNYYCEARPGTALATAAWRIFRSTVATGRIEYADAGAFINAATDLATVQAAFP